MNDYQILKDEAKALVQNGVRLGLIRKMYASEEDHRKRHPAVRRNPIWGRDEFGALKEMGVLR